jgi:hypothetical protein
MTQKVLIVGCKRDVTPAILAKIREHCGDDFEIITPEEAKAQGYDIDSVEIEKPKHREMVMEMKITPQYHPYEDTVLVSEMRREAKVQRQQDNYRARNFKKR